MALLQSQIDRLPPEVVRGRGVYLYDSAGKDYLDGCSGAAVANIGHAVPEMAEAAHSQISEIAYTFRTQFRHAKAEELASKIVSKTDDKVAAFFLSSGSEATESAIRLALQYWQERGQPKKRRILSRLVSYHGNTLGALSMSSDLRRRELNELTVSEPAVAPCYCYRCPYNAAPSNCEIACADDLEEQILRIGAEHIAAFIVEPIVGATGGALVPRQGYLARVREICDRHDVLLIVDEVISGFGRTGKWFATEHWGVSSDLTIMGKGLNAGYSALSAVLLHERLLTAIREGSGRVSIGNTHSCNPLAAALCCEVIDYVDRHDLVARAAARGGSLGRRLKKLANRFDFIGDVRGIGLLWGLEFVADKGTKAVLPAETRATELAVDAAFQNGLLVYPCRGLLPRGGGDAILVAPPLTISESELDDLEQRLVQGLTTLAPMLGGAP